MNVGVKGVAVKGVAVRGVADVVLGGKENEKSGTAVPFTFSVLHIR